MGSTLTKLVARSVSLGDFLAVEEALHSSSWPDYICRIDVVSNQDELLATVRNPTAADGCADPGFFVKTRTFSFAHQGVDPDPTLSVSDREPRIHLVTDERAALYQAAQFIAILVGIVVILFVLLIYFSRLVIQQALQPLADTVNATKLLASRDGADRTMLGAAPREIRPLISEIQQLYESMAQEKADASIGKVASQVAHDIRSPLSALEMILTLLPEVAEEKRTILRMAIGRIRDIAHDLIQKSVSSRLQSEDRPEAVYLLTGLVDSIVSEKRLQYRAKSNIEIKMPIDAHSYGIFVQLQESTFKRILSNLINNAVEAVSGSTTGVIKVIPSVRGGRAVLVVEDNGRGMSPDQLSRLGEKGFTSGKSGGMGLGVHHAKHVVESWGGTFNVESEVGVGTRVTIDFDRVNPPSWFVPSIPVTEEFHVVIVDDDTTIHQVWQKKFKSTFTDADLTITHFTDGAQFVEFASMNREFISLYLVDYELIGQPVNGLELIERLELRDRGILVTSRYEDPAVISHCERIGARMLPKTLVHLVPLERA